jgi:hypothetical protein
LILIPTGKILYGKPGELLDQIKKYQVPASITDQQTSSQRPQVAMNNLPNAQAGSDLSVAEREKFARQVLEDDRRAYATQIESVFWWARRWFWIIVALHAVPLWLGIFNAFVIPRRWKCLTRPPAPVMNVKLPLAVASVPLNQSKQPVDAASKTEAAKELGGRHDKKKRGTVEKRPETK